MDEDYSLLGYVAMLISNVTDVSEELPASIFREVKEGWCHPRRQMFMDSSENNLKSLKSGSRNVTCV